jgi:1-acyl-sn-glycerol-3-phosphate acyltransferase
MFYMEDSRTAQSIVPYASQMDETLTRRVVLGLRAAYSTFYDVRFENEEQLYPIAGKGFVLLPNHQSMQDIMLEGCLLQSFFDKHAHYLMKVDFPERVLDLFHKLGGIELKRGKDMRKMKEEIRHIETDAASPEELRRLREEKRKTAFEAARSRGEEVYGHIVPSLLSQGQIVVSHPEGERSKGKWTEPDISPVRKNLRYLLESQNALGKPITFVPLGIHYQAMYVPRSRVTLRVGIPMEVSSHEDGLERLTQHWAREVTY